MRWSLLVRPTIRFPSPHILHQNLSICHLEALNALVAVKVWSPHFKGQFVHLFSDNATVVAIFQAGKGWNAFIQACVRELWLTCTAWYITLAVGHVPGTSLEATSDALSCWHMGHLIRRGWIGGSPITKLGVFQFQTTFFIWHKICNTPLSFSRLSSQPALAAAGITSPGLTVFLPMYFQTSSTTGLHLH